MNIEIPDYEAIKVAFADELKLASEGKPSSLSFIKHQLPEKPLVTTGIVQGIVIGGTNYVVSTEKVKEDGSRDIIERKTGILPTFSTKPVLIDFLKELLDHRADAIGINFAFPLSPTIGPFNALDGQLINGVKEHNFTGLDEPIGQLAAGIFTEKYQKHIPVSVANDTVCLALAATEKMSGSLIVGTGCNIALRHTIKGHEVLVNLEAGNFDKFTSFSTLEKIDAQSEKPKEYLFEKCVSGKYLFEHFNHSVDEFGLLTPPIHNSLEMSAIANGLAEEPETQLSRQIITRSARMVASAIAGVYNFLGEPKTMHIIGEGNLLWNGWNYKSSFEKQLQDFGIAENTFSLKHITDSNINGAIGLVTSS